MEMVGLFELKLSDAWPKVVEVIIWMQLTLSGPSKARNKDPIMAQGSCKEEVWRRFHDKSLYRPKDENNYIRQTAEAKPVHLENLRSSGRWLKKDCLEGSFRSVHAPLSATKKWL
jgi:hypothetical protein